MDFPFTLTEANLRRAMADRRYTDRRHPQSTVWRGMVAKGWARLYPDELLRGDHTDTLPRHLGDDGGIYASDGTRVGTAPGGRVQVRPYVRTVNGQPVQVSGYDRDAPEGRGGRDANMETPFGNPEPSTLVQPYGGATPEPTFFAESGDGEESKARSSEKADAGDQLAQVRHDQEQPRAGRQAESEFRVDDFADSLSKGAADAPTGKCATYVRKALEEGGMDTSGHPPDAKDWGPTLERNGFKAMGEEDYVPKKGDVVVIQPYPGGSPEGHIAGFDGKQWVSDFKQRDMWGGSGYRKHQPPHAIYRRGD